MTADQLQAESLTYTPPANENGKDFATFMFEVHDGTDPSASAYTMTVHVTAVDDDATGKPVITGTAALGETLTAEKGNIDDLDGLPETFPDDYRFQWVRVDRHEHRDGHCRADVELEHLRAGGGGYGAAGSRSG